MLMRRGAMRARTAPSRWRRVAEALELIRPTTFDAAARRSGARRRVRVRRCCAELKRLSPETEVIVMSERTSLAAAIQWFDPDAFAFVRKSSTSASCSRRSSARSSAAGSRCRTAGWSGSCRRSTRSPTGIARSLELDRHPRPARCSAWCARWTPRARRSGCATVLTGSVRGMRRGRPDRRARGVWTRTCRASRGRATRSIATRAPVHRRGLRASSSAATPPRCRCAAR